MPNVERPFKLDCGAEWQVSSRKPFKCRCELNARDPRPWSPLRWLYQWIEYDAKW